MYLARRLRRRLLDGVAQVDGQLSHVHEGVAVGRMGVDGAHVDEARGHEDDVRQRGARGAAARLRVPVEELVTSHVTVIRDVTVTSNVTVSRDPRTSGRAP